MPASPLKVLLIAPSLDIVGGQAVQADRLLRALRAQPGLHVDFLPFNARLPRPVSDIPFVRTVLRLLVYIPRLAGRVPRCDVLHVFTAAYWSYNLWTLPALFFAKLYRRKIVVNYRDGQAEDHVRNWPAALPTLRRMDAIVSPSGFLVDVFARYGLQGRSIYNIIDMGNFHYRKRNRLRPRFLHNRGLEPLYNVPCTLRAFQLIQQRYPEAELTIAHDGPLRAGLEALARSLGLRNCRFVGKVPQRDMAALYDAADIYLTSPDIDCMPGSLLECYASGLPVVATRAGGIPYIAVHEETALLVPCGDHTALAEASLRLLEDPELGERITAAAYRYCQTFSAGEIGRQWAELYRELTGRAPTGTTSPS
jgi:glycosyltransferase involved in cell wall biosynthesis